MYNKTVFASINLNNPAEFKLWIIDRQESAEKRVYEW